MKAEGKTEKGEVVSKSQFARIIGRSPRTVTTYERAGMPSVRSGSGRGGNRINTAAAIQWLMDQEAARRAPAAGDRTSLDSERLRLTTEQADKLAIENEPDRQDFGAHSEPRGVGRPRGEGATSFPEPEARTVVMDGEVQGRFRACDRMLSRFEVGGVVKKLMRRVSG
jgi:hypothetical protein